MDTKTVQEIVFYLLTLNCVSFMLCKPPFSLATLLSSTLERINSVVKVHPETRICFHPQLFIAPYMYLFNQANGGWIPPCVKTHRTTDGHDDARSTLSRNSHASTGSEESAPKADGIRNFLSEKEMNLLERAKADIKDMLKKNSKQKVKHQITNDYTFSDLQLNTEEEEKHPRATLPKSKDWSIKKRYQAEKLAIQKAREEIVRKKYESKKFCRNQIRLLGKDFLRKSLQQGLQIQQQLANADRILKSAQNVD